MFKYYKVTIQSNKKVGDSITSINKTFKSEEEADIWIVKTRTNIDIVRFLGGINSISITRESYKEDVDGRLIKTQVCTDVYYY